MRIALCPEGSRGDVQPMVALAEELADKGHEIVFIGPPGFEDYAAMRRFEVRSLATDTRTFMTGFAAAVVRPGARQVPVMLAYLRRAIDNQFRALPAATADVDHIIGAGLQIAGPSCAELHGISYEYVAYCPILFRSEHHTPFFVTGAGWPRFANRLAWKGLDWVYAPLVGRLVDRQRALLDLPPVADVVRYLLTDRPKLAADEELAPVPADVAHEVERIGFLLPRDAHEPLPDDLVRFLDEGPPPIYVGFGSMPDPDPVGTTRAIVAAARSTRRRVVIQQGWAELGDEGLPAGVKLIGPVPHASLFPRCALAVHHGGAGSTHTAWRSGTPQRIVPHLVDQFYWHHRIATLSGTARRRPRRQRLGRELSRIFAEAAV